jgi:hypothetical protein
MKTSAIVHRATAERELKYDGYDPSNLVLMGHVNAFMTTRLLELQGRKIFSQPLSDAATILSIVAKRCFSWVASDPITVSSSGGIARLETSRSCL